MNKKVLAVFGNVVLFGQERSNIKVFDTLKKQNVDLLLLVNDRGFQWHIQPEVEAHGLAYKKIRYPWNFRKSLNPKLLWNYLRDIWMYNVQFLISYRQYKPDYIHIANDFYFLTLSPVLLFIKCPLIYRLGDKPVMRYFYEKMIWKKVIVKKVHHFVCISNFIARQLKLIKPNLNNYTIIYNIPPTRKIILEENIPVYDKDWFTVTFVGQIDRIKGVDILFEAAKELITRHNSIRFILAGQTMYSELYKAIQNDDFYKEHKQNFVFLNKVQNIDLVYQNGDIHVAPSVVEEALSNVVGEAKLNKKLSIVFDNGGLAELVSHQKDGYVCKESNKYCLIEAIEYYYNNPEEVSSQGKNAYDSMQNLGLTDEIFTQKWKEVYQID
ncbi:glycosyltransferase family 4 protein [Carboxylicivirga linearis]|uniref:Glycosyltransferase family 4 protein n=1 Tax=Carboxylicivirga linearis TaxID=1628157 RepID=A0ABS5JVP2_9BACT|nr:glycosyltransferase family 4 protein [Carboxylicivirga linearis]MBS2098536.1 glycosyltransferase family 4 protein [Carboxylicivirga linearis]